MANPQKEDGYTPIANEILEQLVRWNLNSYQWRVLVFLLRKTYGWSKPEDAISLSQFACGTGISIPHICRTLKELLNKKIVTQPGSGYIAKYRFNKDFDQWKSLPNRAVVLPNGAIGTARRGNKLLPNGADTKAIKTNNTKQEAKPDSLETVVAFMKDYGVAADFWDYYESKGWVVGKSPMKNWKAAARRWLRQNKSTIKPQEPKETRLFGE